MVFLSAKPRLPLLSVGSDSCITVWDIFAGKPTARFAAEHEAHEPLVGIATDDGVNSLLITADAAGWVKVWAVRADVWATFDEGAADGPARPGSAASRGGGGGQPHPLRRSQSSDKLAQQGAFPVAPPTSVHARPLPPVASAAERGRYLSVLHWWRVHHGGLVSVELIGSKQTVLRWGAALLGGASVGGRALAALRWGCLLRAVPLWAVPLWAVGCGRCRVR
jgi:hypothetical protein